MYWLILFNGGVADYRENLTTHSKYLIVSLNSTHKHNNTPCGKMDFVMPQDVLSAVQFTAVLLRVICELDSQFRPQSLPTEGEQLLTFTAEHTLICSCPFLI